MDRKNKKISLLLSAFIFSSSFLSCSSANSSDSSASSTAEILPSPEETVIEAETSILETLPETDFDGLTMKAAARCTSWWQLSDIDAESINAEPVNDAIFNRNADLEERLNITFEVDQSETDQNNLARTLRRLATSGDQTFDIIFPFLTGAAEMAQDDLLFDLKKIDTIDLSNPAWDQNANHYFDLSNKLYFGVSDISLAKNETLWTYMFNKRMLKDFNMENPYDLVREGRWTLDKCYEMMSSVTADLDGDGKMGPNDRYGLGTHEINCYALLISSGQPLVTRGPAGEIVPNLETEQFLDVYDKVLRLFSDATQDSLMEYKGESFIAGNSLLCAQTLACVRMYRSMEDDFGLIPPPKYDEEQQEYYSYAIPYEVVTAAIPVTARDAEKSGTLLQYLAVLSDYYVTPAYYEVTITGKGLRDDDSGDMLDIIRGSVTYDLARMFDWGHVAGTLDKQMYRGMEFTTHYKRRSKSFHAGIEETLLNFDNNKT